MKKVILTLLIVIMLFPVFSVESKKECEQVRIQNVMAKIRRGEPVQVIALGGSITTGYNANPIKTNSWAAITENWLKDLAVKNNCKLSFANQGVSGTDSAFAIARYESHVEALNPDLIILEFAMNDQWLDPKVRKRTYEAIIRKAMENKETAILALFVNQRKAPYASNQAEQEKICKYYNIPYVSWKDLMERDNALEDFEKYFDGAEDVHPNNAGHEKIAGYIIEKLDEIWKNLPSDKKLPAVEKSLPKVLSDNGFINAKYYTSKNIEPTVIVDWEKGSPVHSEWTAHGNSQKGWQSKVPGSELCFEIEASSIGITYCESDQFRNAIAWVTKEDGFESQRIPLTCFQSSRKGYYGWAYKEIVDGKNVEKYTLHVQCSKRAQKSAEGKYCNITGILAAGEK